MAFNNFNYSGGLGSLLGALGQMGGDESGGGMQGLEGMPPLYMGDQSPAQVQPSMKDPGRYIDYNYRDVSNDSQIGGLLGQLNNMPQPAQKPGIMTDVNNYLYQLRGY